MAFYEDLRDNTVIPLIEQFGQSVTLTRTQDASDWVKEFVPAEGRFRWRNTVTNDTQYDAPTAVQVTVTGNGVITIFQSEAIDESNILSTDRLLLTYDLGVPLLGDIITVGGVDYNYINHNTVSPGGIDVLYRIQLRV